MLLSFTVIYPNLECEDDETQELKRYSSNYFYAPQSGSRAFRNEKPKKISYNFSSTKNLITFASWNLYIK